MKNIFSKRVLSLLLALVITLGIFPMSTATVLAADRFVDNDKIDLNISEVVLNEGRLARNKYISVVYTADVAVQNQYPAGTDVSEWFTNLPGNVRAYIGSYETGTWHYPTADDDAYKLHKIRIYFAGAPDDAAPYYKYELEIPASFYTDGQAKTFKGNTKVEELGSACSGCTLKTINGFQVCYKEGKGIHVCELNFGSWTDEVGSKWDKSPEDGYISPEEEPSKMTDSTPIWHYFDIEEVYINDNHSDDFTYYYLSCFPNLREVKMVEGNAVVFFGENNANLEIIDITTTSTGGKYGVTGLGLVPSSAPLREVKIQEAQIDRGIWNFPTLEKLVLKDCSIAYMDGDYAVKNQITITKDCAALKRVDLNGTDISGKTAGYPLDTDLENLEYIDISNTGTSMLNIAYFPNLKYLYAENNALATIVGARGENGKTLADKCPNLVEVDVSGNNLTEFVVGQHTALKKLDLSNNDFTAYSLANVPSIEEFTINQANEAGVYENKLQTLYVIDCPNLKVLDAGYQMNPNFALALDNLPALKELDLTECRALTDLPLAVKNSVEILKVDNCTNWDIVFSGDEFKNLRVLYAKNVTCPDAGGTKYFGATAPTIEEVYYNGTKGVTHIGITSPKLKSFTLENCDSLTAVDASRASSLKSLYLGKNKNLETLTLDDNFALETIDIHVDDTDGVSKITSLDMSDCYSLVKVGVSKDAEKIRILYPEQLDNPDIKMTGWKYKDCYGDWHNGRNEIYYESKFSDKLSDHGCNHYRGQDDDEGNWWWPDCCTVGSDFTWMHFPDKVDDNDYNKEYRYRTWNFTRWTVGGSDSEKTAYKADFNFSPYKESHKIVSSTYYVTALNAEESGIPGLVGWADKKFATEEEILYYPGEQFVLTKDIELFPVYNTETKVDYYVGNYGNDIIVDEEAIKALGLEEGYNTGYYSHTLYEKSSLSDYWTYEVLDFVPSWEGYIFQGWKYATASDVFVYQPGDKIEFEGDKGVTLSAKWEKKVDMPSAYTYLSCDDPYFEKGHSVSLTAKVVGLGGADLSNTDFKAFLYLYEEGKEHEKEKVVERTFTGDEVTLTFTYPADDTRIAYVEIYRYEGGNYSQKSITDDYVLTPAKEMDVEFLYSIGDGYVSVTKDTTITLPQGANDGWIDIEVDALWGKGDLDIRLYETSTGTTVGTEMDTVVSTNTIGTKSYRAAVTDKTGITVYTSKLTVVIVPELEVTSTSDDREIAKAEYVNFTVEYVGYNVKTQFTDENGNTVSGLETQNRPGNERNGYAGTVVFTVLVTAPASGNTAEYTYNAVLTDEFGNRYENEFHVYFDKTKGLTFAADGRGTLKFYDYYNGADYAAVFATGTDVAAELDGGWLYDIMDSLYASDRNQHPDNVLIPIVGDGVEVSVKLIRYDSYAAYKNGGASVNVYEQELGSDKVDSSGYVDISNKYGESSEYLPGTIDLFGDMTPGYYVMTLSVRNSSAAGYYEDDYCFDIYGAETWSASGSFEILAAEEEHVHDYKIEITTGNFDETPHSHSYKCFCGASYEEDHAFPAAQADDLPWLNFMMNGYDTNVERRFCTLCGGGAYRWRFIESFTIGNADLQEGKTDAYELLLSADQTVNLAASLQFVEYVNPNVSQSTQDTYNGLASGFYPVNAKINWTSSNQDVAKVDENGVVTTVGEGTALITGTTVQPGKETGEPMTVTVLINVNCKHTAHKVKVPAQEPTCQADGHIEHYMCLDCTKYSLTGDFTDTVSYENDVKIAQVDHAKLYGVWHSDASGHWRECKYGCGTKYDEGSHYSTTPANCQHPESCNTCGYVLSPVTGHSHDKYGWSEGYHWSICECGLVVEGSNEVHQFGADGSSDTCDDCGYKKNVGYTVSGTITSYLKAEGDITVQLLSGEEVAYSQVFNTYSGTSTYTTEFSIPAVTDGTYTMRVSKANHVTRDYTITVSGGAVTQDAAIHPIGDVTQDGKVNGKDWNRLYEHVSKVNELEGYALACGEVTNDTKCNMKDWNRLYEHVTKVDELW